MVVAPLKASHNVLYGIAFARKKCYTAFMANHLLVREPHALIPAQVAAEGATPPGGSSNFSPPTSATATHGGLRPGRDAFFRWCDAAGSATSTVQPVDVAAYVEQLKTRAAPSVKQHLAAIRMLFDWLVVGQVVPMNPAASVRAEARRQARQNAGPVGRGSAAASSRASPRTWSGFATGR